jgi:hypothetical protein
MSATVATVAAAAVPGAATATDALVQRVGGALTGSTVVLGLIGHRRSTAGYAAMDNRQSQKVLVQP